MSNGLEMVGYTFQPKTISESTIISRFSSTSYWSIDIAQSTGTSTTSVMSQAAISEKLNYSTPYVLNLTNKSSSIKGFFKQGDEIRIKAQCTNLVSTSSDSNKTAVSVINIDGETLFNINSLQQGDVSEVSYTFTANTDIIVVNVYTSNYFTELEVKIDLKNTFITSIENNITSIENNITSIENNITSIENNITSIENNITSIENNITSEIETAQCDNVLSEQEYSTTVYAANGMTSDGSTLTLPIGESGTGSQSIRKYFFSTEDRVNIIYFKVVYSKTDNLVVYPYLRIANDSTSEPSTYKIKQYYKDDYYIIEGVIYNVYENIGEAAFVLVGVNIQGTTVYEDEQSLTLISSVLNYTITPLNNKTRQDSILEEYVDSRLQSYTESTKLADPIKKYESIYTGQIFNNAVQTSNGFIVPTGETGQSSFVSATLNNVEANKETNIECYFSKNITDAVLSTYITISNKEGSSVKYTLSATLLDNGLYCLHLNTILSSDEYNEFSVIKINIQKTSTTTFNEDLEVTIINSSYYQLGGINDFSTKTIMELIEESKASNINEIAVTADENDDSFIFKGKNAIQEAIDSITDASEYNKYTIYVKQGIYKITNSSEYIGDRYEGANYPAMICMKDYVDVVGMDKDSTIIWAELPYSDDDIDTEISRSLHQTVWNHAKEATIKNCTLVAKNIRYVIHQDYTGGADSNRYYENVNLQFIGDKGYKTCWGLGTRTNENTYIKGGRTIAGDGLPFSTHNNSYFDKPSLFRYEEHEFFSANNDVAFKVINCGSLLKDQVSLINCIFSGQAYIIQYTPLWLRGGDTYAAYNHDEWRISGYGNSPFLFENSVNDGLSLKITSATTGSSSKVRFSESSSAFDSIIKNPRIKSGAVSMLEVNYTDGYLYKDGSVGLSGWANGCIDLSGVIYTHDDTIYNSLGIALGDCSSVSKNLIVSIDGVEKEITFNQDYSNLTNAEILLEINTVLSESGTADLYCTGREYFPEMTDVMEICLNGSDTSPIPRGTVVTKLPNGRINPCQETDTIYGVVLDDTPVYSVYQGEYTGYTRVMKKGYIYTEDKGYYHFVKCSTTPSTGDFMKVVDGELVKDANGVVYCKEDSVIAINC